MAGSETMQLDAELTIAQVEVWQKRFLDETPANNKMMIDASDLVRVDAAGLQLLLAFKKSCAAKNVAATLFNVPKNIQELIRVSGLTQELG